MATKALPEDWRTALAAAAGARRVMVIGATDMGKSHFTRQLLAKYDGRVLVDLDPGQKMVGAPGTLSLGRLDGDGRLALERFVFTGSASPVDLRAFLAAARPLLADIREPLTVNTCGLVRGAGVRLQRVSIEAVQPDLIVAIADGPELDPILANLSGIAFARVRRPLLARGKGLGERRRARRQAFAAALDGAARQRLPTDIAFEPAPPAPFQSRARPVCAIVDAGGRHLAIGILEAIDAAAVTVFTPGPCPPMARVLLGRMWAEPSGQAWRLLERGQPAWDERLPDRG